MRCIMAAEFKNGQKPETLLGHNTGRFSATKRIYGQLRGAVARSTRVKSAVCRKNHRTMVSPCIIKVSNGKNKPRMHIRLWQRCRSQ